MYRVRKHKEERARKWSRARTASASIKRNARVPRARDAPRTEMEGLIMLTMMIIMMFCLFFGILRLGFHLAWGSAKFLFGLGLFWTCPLLFLLAVMFGWLGHMWLPILIIGLLCGRGFARV